MATTQTIREARMITIHMRAECGSEETTTARIPDGTEDEQHKAAWAAAEAATEEWCRSGEWGTDGASVSCHCWWEDADVSWEDAESYVMVEIEPDHDALIRAAGGDTDCDHEWVATCEIEGGCRENPGVWSNGGTSMTFRTHCACCGLKRTERRTGSQRNRGEHDTVSYEMPTDEELTAMGIVAEGDASE